LVEIAGGVSAVTIETNVAEHYTQGTLEQRILTALREAGKDPDRLDSDDLAPVDEFHHGGRAATAAFAPRLGLRPGISLLEIGSGIGGPARYFARHHGCHVTGIDLTEEFIAVSRALTRRLGMEGQVSFEQGSALSMPFADATFHVATLLHVGMNIGEKARLFAEVRRVLRPGGIFGIYDQMREADGDLTFPVPWASVPQTSFVETPAAYKRLLTESGFEVIWERSCREDALASFNQQMAAKPGSAALPPLGVQVTMGLDAAEKMANHRSNLEHGLVAPNEIVARAPAP
jgi:ubiquinone/menaquinone biosynthesis C-methylase UbiE